MSMMSEKDREMVRTHLDQNLHGNVEIIMFTESESLIIVPGKQPCETCKQTQQLLEEITDLSDKLTLTVHDISSAPAEAATHEVDRVPAIVLKGAARGRVRFFGIPSGYEFSAFVQDLIDTSKGSTDLSDETRQYLSTLAADINIKVFTTPS